MAEQKTIGQIACEAWFCSLSLKDGKTPMDWPGDMHKDDWEAAASAVWNKAVEECAQKADYWGEGNWKVKLEGPKPRRRFDRHDLQVQVNCTGRAIAEDIRSLKHSDKTEKADG